MQTAGRIDERATQRALHLLVFFFFKKRRSSSFFCERGNVPGSESAKPCGQAAAASHFYILEFFSAGKSDASCFSPSLLQGIIKWAIVSSDPSLMTFCFPCDLSLSCWQLCTPLPHRWPPVSHLNFVGSMSWIVTGRRMIVNPQPPTPDTHWERERERWLNAKGRKPLLRSQRKASRRPWFTSAPAHFKARSWQMCNL